MANLSYRPRRGPECSQKRLYNENFDENANQQSGRGSSSKKARKEMRLIGSPIGTSEEEVFQKGMKDLLDGLKDSPEMMALKLREKEADINAKEAALENQKAMTQLMMALISKV